MTPLDKITISLKQARASLSMELKKRMGVNIVYNHVQQVNFNLFNITSSNLADFANFANLTKQLVLE